MGDEMAYRKTYILTKHRITQAVLRKLQRAAVGADRSVSEEVGRRLEESFRIEKERKQMDAEREAIDRDRKAMARNHERLVEGLMRLNLAMLKEWLAEHPKTEAAIEVLRDYADGFIGDAVMEELKRDEES
jgi:hypothetical protein